MFGDTSSKAFCKRSCAGCMSDVWKAPPVFNSLACKAPFFSTIDFNSSTAASVPAQAKPFGKSEFATRQTEPDPAVFSASLQQASNTDWSRPATESMACLPTWAASCMASPRSFTRRRPSSKLKTPAAHRAVYSPKERPATHCGRSAASARSLRSLEMPARPPTNMAGWQYFVSASFSSGPLRQSSNRSYPRIGFAFASMSLTSGISFTPSSILTYWEPWPGNKSASGKGGAAGTADGAGAAAGAGAAGAAVGLALGSAYSLRLFTMPSS
mmetsp:Transcript_85901/g.152159  ORF Transcript_85901/g.152159 Transcript_85901/m.152159 type:complete len:270 (+) Transcript_85901:298-1107(+)